MGKSIYEFSDEARYNDYVLIDETPDAPQTAKKKAKAFNVFKTLKAFV